MNKTEVKTELNNQQGNGTVPFLLLKGTVTKGEQKWQTGKRI